MKKIGVIILIISSFVACKSAKSVVGNTDIAQQINSGQQSDAFLYYFYDAQRCLSNAEYDRGMALLLFCEQLNPNDAAVQQSLGYMYQGLQQHEVALSHYKRAFEGDKVMYWSNYASLLFQMDKKEEAAKILEDVITLLPDDTEPLEALSTIYTGMGDYKKALDVQDKIERIEGINSYNVTSRYRILWEQGQRRKAVQVVERYCNENPEDVRFAVFKGDLYLATDRANEAYQTYEQLYRRHSDNPYVCLAMAKYCENMGDNDRAADYTRQAIESEEWDAAERLKAVNDYKERLEKAELTEIVLKEIVKDFPLSEDGYIALSRYYIGKEQYAEAKPVLQTLLAMNPESNAAYKMMMTVLLTDSMSSNNEYELLIRQAYRQLPNDLEWHYWMTRVLLVNQQTDSAVIVARRAVKIETEDARYRLPLWILLGDIYSVKQEWDSTYLAYEEALKLDPQNIYTLNNYAYMLAIHGGDLRKAEQMSQKTIEEEPDNATYLDTYAWIMYLQGQRSLAEFYIRKAMDKMTEIESEDIKQHYEEIIKSK